jgi:hypothetical protein
MLLQLQAAAARLTAAIQAARAEKQNIDVTATQPANRAATVHATWCLDCVLIDQ